MAGARRRIHKFSKEAQGLELSIPQFLLSRAMSLPSDTCQTPSVRTARRARLIFADLASGAKTALVKIQNHALHQRGRNTDQHSSGLPSPESSAVYQEATS